MQEDLPIQPPEVDTTKDMVDWSNPPTLMNLKQDLTDAQSDHKLHTGRIDTWLDNLHVRNKAAMPNDTKGSKVVPKLIRKQAEWRYPALSEPYLSTDDVFNVKPISWEDQKAAEQNELLLNYQFNNLMNKQKLIDESVRQAVDEGTIIARLSWLTREEDVLEDVPTVQFTPDPSYEEELMTYIQMEAESPSDFMRLDQELRESVTVSREAGMPMRPSIVDMQQEVVTKVVENRPVVELCDYRNVVFDPTCNGDLSKARFIVHSFAASLDSLKADGKYTNLDKIQIDTNSIQGDPDYTQGKETGNFNFNDNTRKKFVVQEYWGHWDIDGDGTTKSIVAAWVGNTVIRLEENPFPGGQLPFVTCQYLPVRGSVYGEPDGALLEENQKINGALMRGMIDVMGKSANAQTGMRSDMLDAANKIKFRDGRDYEFNPGVDPRQGVHMHTFGEIPASAQYLMELIQQEAESLTGVKAFNNGISASSLGDVAAGIRSAMDAASKRELGILRRLSKFWCEIARRVIAMNAVFMSEEEVIRVTNGDFVKIDRNDLPGNFDLTVTVSTAEEDNNKAQELAFMLQTMGNTIPMELVQQLLARLFKLRKMPDLAKFMETYQPPTDPIQQEMAQMELELRRAEVQEKIADSQKRAAEAQLATAKIETEIAKARNINADTDLMNQDFVRTETGVKHIQDLQKQAAQAEAQTQTKIVSQQLQDQSDEKKDGRKFAQDLILNEQANRHKASAQNKFVQIN